MKTTQDHAAEIRAELKASGIKARSVSVRCDLYSMGSTLRLVVKDPSVSISKVRAIAEAHSRIDRDSMSGEILCGGCRFVDVDYLDEMVEPYAAAVLAAIVDLPADGSEREVAGERVFRDFDAWRTFGRGEARGLKCYDARTLARQLAENALDRGEPVTLPSA